MHLSEHAVKYPRLVLLIGLIVCGVGVASLFNLPKERTPRVKLPVIVVATPNPGATPDANERNIVRKLEDEIAETIDGLRDEGSIIAQTVQGGAIFQIVFDHGTDVEKARHDIQQVVNRVKGEFPEDARDDPGPQVRDIAFDDFPIIQVVIAGGTDGAHRRRVSERLEKLIRNVDGIASVDLFGGIEPEVQIEIDPNLLASYGLSPEDVYLAIRRANEDTPTGELETDQGASHRVRMMPKLQTIADIEQITLGIYDEKPVTVADVASVRMGHKQRKSIARYGGQDAAVLLVRAKSDVDVLATATAVQDLVDVFNPGDPSITIGTSRSQAREIRWMLQELGTSALYCEWRSKSAPGGVAEKKCGTPREALLRMAVVRRPAWQPEPSLGRRPWSVPRHGPVDCNSAPGSG